MTLQASGAISLSQLRGEFGGSAPDSLSEYYRGGALVPNISANNAVPTLGAIKLSDFYNATDFNVSIDAIAAGDVNPAPAVNLTVNTNGTITTTGNTTTGPTRWGTPTTTGAGSSYWVRLTVNSGSAPSGSAVGSWLQLSSARAWSFQAGSGANITLAIATDSGGSNIVDTETGNVTLTPV